MLFKRAVLTLSFALIPLGIAALAGAQVLGNGFASSFAVVGTTTGGVTAFGGPTLLKAGLTTYNTGEGDGTRWGDYSATVRDPSTPGSFWTIQEFAAGPTVWGTQVTQLTVGAGGQVAIGRNFTSMTQGASIVTPPDTDGAVGPSHYAHLINGYFAVFDKSGSSSSPVFTESLSAFWVAAGDTTLTSTVFDPRLVYDRSSARWFASSLDNAFQANHFLLAVSNDSDPTHGFKMVSINSDTSGRYWADFDRLGVNADGVYLSGNMFLISGDQNDPNYVKTSSFVLPKADLLGATPTAANLKRFELTDQNLTGYSQQPVVDVGLLPGASPEQFLSDGIVTNGPSNALRVSTITGTGAGASFNPSAGLVTLATGFTPPPNAPQPGNTTALLDTSDGRFSGSAIRIGSDIWAVNSIAVNGRAGLQWYQINAGNYALKQSGLLSDPNLYFYEGSISADESGNVVIGFTGSGTGLTAAATPEPGVNALLIGLFVSGGLLLRRRRRDPRRIVL
jgi:hypothetical protein